MSQVTAKTPIKSPLPKFTGLQSSKILVVDDNEFSRKIASEIFSAQKFGELEFANDGEEAIEKTKTFKPDLVLLDLMMPKIDGYSYCKIMRADPEFKRMPILVQSGVSKTEQIAKVFEAGATDFVSKPINADELVARAKVHLENRMLMHDLSVYQQRVAKELENAKEMQNSILPTGENIQEIEEKFDMEIAAYFATCSELGGDFWGVTSISHAELGVYAVDFSGHGVTAALNTFRLHTILQEPRSFFSSPALFLSKLNKRLAEMLSPGQFATMFYGVINVEEGVMQYATAGAPAPMILKSTGEVEMVRGEGVPLGAVPGMSYTEHELSFIPGDALFMYSDALIETEDANGNFIDEASLIRFLGEQHAENAKTKLQKLIAYFYNHAVGDIEDDLTVNMYRRL